jgi:hypothetical protein
MTATDISMFIAMANGDGAVKNMHLRLVRIE